MKERKLPKTGDVIEVETPKGFAYLQYTFMYDAPPVYGELVRVLPGLYDNRPNDFQSIVQRKERYFVFFPLGIEARRGNAKIVGHEQIPPWASGMPLMRKSAWPAKGWWLWEGKRKQKVEFLNSEQAQLSIAQVWNYPMLIHRIAEGWSPACEVRNTASDKNGNETLSTLDRSEASHVLSAAGIDVQEPQEVRHFLYFRRKSLAERAAKTIQTEGYKVEIRKASDGKDWLALASKLAVVNAHVLEETRSRLEALATSCDGTYDGWEVRRNL